MVEDTTGGVRTLGLHGGDFFVSVCDDDGVDDGGNDDNDAGLVDDVTLGVDGVVSLGSEVLSWILSTTFPSFTSLSCLTLNHF